MLPLGTRNICVSVNLWHDNVKVHFRKFVKGADGRKLPTKTGITLNLDEFSDLKAQMQLIDKEIYNVMYVPKQERPDYQRQNANYTTSALTENINTETTRYNKRGQETTQDEWKKSRPNKDVQIFDEWIESNVREWSPCYLE